MVFRPSGADFQGIGVYRSDEGWGRGGEELSHAPTSSSRWSPTISLLGCFPGVVKGFNNKAKVTWENPVGSTPSELQKSYYIRHLVSHVSRSLPTDSADEANK